MVQLDMRQEPIVLVDLDQTEWGDVRLRDLALRIRSEEGTRACVGAGVTSVGAVIDADGALLAENLKKEWS